MSNNNSRISVLVCETVIGYTVAYVFDWDVQNKFYSAADLKTMWDLVKKMAKSDYGYHNAIIGSGVVVNVSESQILPEHKKIAADSYDLSFSKQFAKAF